MQILGTNLVWRAVDDLICGQDSVFDQPSDDVIGHTEFLCRLGHGAIRAILVGGEVTMDAIDPADRGDAFGVPGLALASQTYCNWIRVPGSACRS